MNVDRLIERLKKEEGFSPKSFLDDAPGGSTGERWTWGYGTKAPGPGCGISEAQATIELRDKVEQHVTDAHECFPLFPSFDEVRQEALVDMIFNLGESRFRGFKKMIRAINKIPPDWFEAAYQAQESIWFKQVGKRSGRIVKELATGIVVEIAV